MGGGRGRAESRRHTAVALVPCVIWASLDRAWEFEMPVFVRVVRQDTTALLDATLFCFFLFFFYPPADGEK